MHGTLIGNKSTLFQAARFSIVGVLNTIIDFAVLNALIFFFTTESNTLMYGLFKMFSFLAALLNSYLFNRYWVFPSKKKRKDPQEKFRFIGVSVIGLILNITISTLFFSTLIQMNPTYPVTIANTGAILGTLIVLLWNFFGYKFFVFKHAYEK